MYSHLKKYTDEIERQQFTKEELDEREKQDSLLNHDEFIMPPEQIQNQVTKEEFEPDHEIHMKSRNYYCEGFHIKQMILSYFVCIFCCPLIGIFAIYYTRKANEVAYFSVTKLYRLFHRKINFIMCIYK